MVTALNSTEELFVISDLHIGGKYGSTTSERGFRINTHVKELTQFVHEIRQRGTTKRKRIELVINGDFVDFLAEEGADNSGWRAFIDDEEEAVSRLDDVVKRDLVLFDALAELVESGITLTLLLGNHDLELCLPLVRARLREHIRASRTSPFQFIYDGEAYVVGDTLIEHGNRYDGFNVVDYDVLRRYRSESSRRLPMSPDAIFIPPPGSQLVEQIMNPIKKDYGFVDLLKPETDAAIPLLLALEPSLGHDIATINTLAQLNAEARERNPIAPARPARPGDIRSEPTSKKSTAKTLKEVLEERMSVSGRGKLLALMEEAEQQSKRASSQIGSTKVGRALSFARMVLFTKEWEDRVALLLEGFRQVQSATLFGKSVETEIPYWKAAQELVRGGFVNVLFGHTHLAKDVPLPDGAKYLNTGTWADLMQLPSAVFGESETAAAAGLREFAIAVKNGTFDDYVDFRPTFAYVRLDETGRSLPGGIETYKAGIVREL
jgi:UDP-2,3-diacylglucosamine pyrophosphatase LpxH